MSALRLTATEPVTTVPSPDGITPELIARARRGDAAAFEEIYHHSAPRVFALCRRLSGTPAEAAELTQDTFVRVWERLGTFRGDSTFVTWLHRLATNVVLERLRTEKRRAARFEAASDIEVVAPATHGAPGVETRLDLDAALARLGETARLVFVLREMEGYDYQEISALTGLSQVALRSQFHRARKQLMEMLTP